MSDDDEDAVEFELGEEAQRALASIMAESRERRDAELRQKRGEDQRLQVYRNEMGLQLFLTRTAGQQHSLIDALEQDPGDSLTSLDALRADPSVDESAIVFSIVLIPKSGVAEIEKFLRVNELPGEKFLEQVRKQSVVYVTANHLAWKMTESIATEMFGWPLKRGTPGPTEMVSGWANHNVPPIGHHASLRVVVDSALKECSTVWATAGSTNTFVELSAPQLIELSSGEWGPSLEEYAAA